MENAYISLELTLNNIIDSELQKNKDEQDTNLISECVDALLRMENYEKYKLSSEKVNENIREILSTKRKKHISKTARIILAAAIIVIIAAVCAFGYAQYKYNIIDFGKYSKITAQEKSGGIGKNISVGYVPAGFTLADESRNAYYTMLEYVNGDKTYNIIIQAYTDENTINTEYGVLSEIRKDGIVFFAFGEKSNEIGILRIENDLLYTVCGNISKDEMIKIAGSIE